MIPHIQALQPRLRQQQQRRISLVTTYHPRLTTLTKNSQETPPHTTRLKEAETSHSAPTSGNL